MSASSDLGAVPKTAYLFPGQGSQFVGMGRDLYESHGAAREIFDQADRILGIGLKAICFSGPEESLRETEFTQPAIFTHSMAVLAALGGLGVDPPSWPRELGPGPFSASAFAAGHSLGEYSAYVAAGSLDFEPTLALVRRRGELMAAAGRERPGAMAAILGLDLPRLRDAISGVEGVVGPANLNSPGQIVISGEVNAVDAAMDACRAAGARRAIRLEVAGAFHSPLMRSAAHGLREALEALTPRRPRCAVLANESAAVVAGGPEAIRASLTRQLLSPVRWEATIHAMLDDGVRRFVEIGPGKVLSGLVRSIAKEYPSGGCEVEVVAVGTSEQLAAATDGRERSERAPTQRG